MRKHLPCHPEPCIAQSSCSVKFPATEPYSRLPGLLSMFLFPQPIHWGRKWQPSPVFLPGKSHGQRSLESSSPWGHKRVKHDLATKQQQNNLCLYLCTFSIQQPNLTHPKPNLMTPTLYTQHTHTHIHRDKIWPHF